MRLPNQAEHKQAEELYRSVVELAPDSIVTVDMKGVITSSNTASTRILGYSKDELVGKHFSKIGVFRPRDIPKFLKLFNSALRGEVTEPLELTLYRKDGTSILAEVRVGVLKEGGKTIGLQAVSRDIIERKRAEEALRESEERLRAQYKGIPVPAYTWQRVGEDFVLVDYNDAAHAITRGNVADFVGRAASEMYRDRPDIIEELSRCFAQKTSIKRAMEYGFTTTGETKHLAVTYIFVPPNLVMVHTEDITERKRAEEEIRRRSEELAALYDVSLDVAAQLDLDTLLKTILLGAMELLRANAGGLYLYHPERQDLELIVHQGLRKDYRGIRLALGQGACGKVAQTGEPLVVTDYSNWEGRSSHFADEPTFNVLAVAIKRGDTLLGALYVDDPDMERRFEERDVRLATLFANQAAIAMENARLYEEERRRSLQRKTIAEVGRAIAAILDPDTLLSRVVHLIAQGFGYYRVHIFQADQDSGHAVYRAGTGEAALTIAEEGLRLRIGEEGLVGWVALHGQPLLVNDVSQDLRYYSHPELPDTRSELDVPIRLGERIIGVLDVQSTELNAFDESDLFTLQTLADQAAVAIENARLHEETQRRLRELQMLHQASASILSSLELDKTLQLIMDSTVKAIPSAQKGSLHLLDEERNELVMRAGYGFSPEVMKAATFKVGEGYAGWALVHNQPVIIDNVATDARFKPIDLPEVREEKSAICAPLVVKGKSIGTITLDNVTSYGAFDEDDLQLLSAFADQAVIAIENARLYEETKRLAATDPLTGVWNRRHIGERLRTEVARSRRSHHSLSVLVMDIDNLKLFNDSYGHVTGDNVIRTVAQAILTSCREIDIVGRYGGDEFAVILPEAEARGAAIVAGRILAALEREPFQASNGAKVPINISIGAASYPSDSDEADRLFSLADAAMYRAKVAGGGQFASLTVGPEEVPAELVAPFDVLQGLLITVDAKDRYTFKHSQEVTERALALARAVGLSDEEVTALEVAGKLHDVGKIGIPTNVLRKPGPLTAEEWKMIRQHPRLGHMILQQLPQMEVILDAVLYHHERWDGKGYPDGLKGKQIPKLARILAIADAYSAMLTDRPYRKALSEQEALQEMQNCAGSQFDPELAELFADLVL